MKGTITIDLKDYNNLIEENKKLKEFSDIIGAGHSLLETINSGNFLYINKKDLTKELLKIIDSIKEAQEKQTEKNKFYFRIFNF